MRHTQYSSFFGLPINQMSRTYQYYQTTRNGHLNIANAQDEYLATNKEKLFNINMTSSFPKFIFLDPNTHGKI